jgi:hypothetical protein
MSVANGLFMLSVVILSVVMLTVNILSAIMLIIIVLSARNCQKKRYIAQEMGPMLRTGQIS